MKKGEKKRREGERERERGEEVAVSSGFRYHARDT
jgi:hypothetical protein